MVGLLQVYERLPRPRRRNAGSHVDPALLVAQAQIALRHEAAQADMQIKRDKAQADMAIAAFKARQWADIERFKAGLTATRAWQRSIGAPAAARTAASASTQSIFGPASLTASVPREACPAMSRRTRSSTEVLRKNGTTLPASSAASPPSGWPASMSLCMKSWCAVTGAISSNSGVVEDLKASHRLARISVPHTQMSRRPREHLAATGPGWPRFCPRFIPPLGQDREGP